MISVRAAMAKIEKKFPDKRLRGTPFKIGDLLLFQYVNKTATEKEAKWDNGLIGVDAVTGKMSNHSFFDEDIMGKGIPISEY